MLIRGLTNRVKLRAGALVALAIRIRYRAELVARQRGQPTRQRQPAVRTPHFRADTKRTSAGKLSPFALEYS